MTNKVATSELAIEDEVETPEGSGHSFSDMEFVRKYIEEQRKFSDMEAFSSNTHKMK